MESQQPRDPWSVAFALSVVAFVASCAVLGVVLFNGRGDDLPAAVAGSDTLPEPTDNAPVGRVLQFVGQLPKGLDPALFRGAFDPRDADISFEPTDDAESVVHRYFVPVVPLLAGLDSVTRNQLEELLGGRLAFADVGGLGGVPQFVIASTASDARTVRSFTQAAPVTIEGDSYEALYEAMADPGSALIAFLPLEELRPSMSALAVDGLDIVRGRGDADAWPFVERINVRGITKEGNEAAPAILAALNTPLPRVTTVVATGDILQSRCSLAQIMATGDWGAALRGAVGEYLAAADLTFGSLDGSIQDINPPYLCVPGTNLSSPPEVMEALLLAGFDGLTVATNHIFDCGIEYCGTQAFLRTLELLDEAGIKYVGGGRNLEEALAPAIFEVNGISFGVLGFDDVAAYELEATDDFPGTAPLDDSYEEELAAGEPAFFRPAEELSLTRFTERIRTLKQRVDVVIVLVQTGTEDTHDPSPRSIKALRAAADAGADLVVGNQAHHVQAVETRGDTFIAYALGNFIFDQLHTPEHTQGYILEAAFLDDRLANVRMVPYQIEDQYKPTFVDGALRAKILADVFNAYLPPQD